MKKSNVIIIAILIIASIFFLWLWYYLGLNVVDNPRDLILTILWWIVVVAVCIGIHFAERIRQKNIRTAFLAPGLIYNSESGIVRFEPPAEYVSELQAILDALEYNFERPDEPNQSRIRFKYIVHTAKFDKQGDVWEGEVLRVNNPDNPIPFNSREELANILAA